MKPVVAIAALAMAWQMAVPPIALAQFWKRSPNKPDDGRIVTCRGAGTYARRCKPKAPKDGRFVTRRGAASRGCAPGKTLLPLAPTEQINDAEALIPKLSTGGFTAQAHPSFWFQVPFSGTELEELEFILQDENDEDIYRASLESQSASDLLQVTFPRDNPGLAMDQRYRWILRARLNCGPDSPSGLQFVKGWIQRYEPEASLVSQLAAATPLKQAQLYAEAGVWFDALNILAPLQNAEPQSAAPQNAASQAAWQDLMKLYAIELQPSN